jgi:hypothetical protein
MLSQVSYSCNLTKHDSSPLGTSASRGVRAGPDRSRYRDPKKNILTRDHREQTQHLDQLPIYALSVFFVLFSFLNDTLEYVEKETIVGFPVGALVGTVTDLETTPYFS